jgi:Cu/Ag efflux protein CusF
MMKPAIVLAIVAALAGTPALVAQHHGHGHEQTEAKPAKSYPLSGTIVSRDVEKNRLVIDHEEIEGWMKAMKMPFEVRGAKVAELPADGSKITATVHVAGGKYWITDVTTR